MKNLFTAFYFLGGLHVRTRVLDPQLSGKTAGHPALRNILMRSHSSSLTFQLLSLLTAVTGQYFSPFLRRPGRGAVQYPRSRSFGRFASYGGAFVNPGKLELVR